MELLLAIVIPVVALVLVGTGILVWHRHATANVIRTTEANPYNAEFDRKAINTALDWYILRHLEDQVRMPVVQRFLDIDRQYNDLLNRFARHVLKLEGIEMEMVHSTAKTSERPAAAKAYVPRYFPDAEMDSALVMFKHERIGRRHVNTVQYLERLRRRVVDPLKSFEALRPGCCPFVPDGYTVFYNNLIATGQDFDGTEGLREEMRKLAAQMVFPRFREHYDFWVDKGVTIYQIPDAWARDALEGWFYLDVTAQAMPMPELLLREEG